MDQKNLEQIIKEVLSNISTPQSAGGASSSFGGSGTRVTFKDYPLGEKSADKLKTPTGKSINDVTFDAVLKGDIKGEDVRIRPETLEMQAQVAESVGRKAFAQNLRRAAELIPVPDKRLIEMYNALRPYHSTKQELLDIAGELESKYKAVISAKHVREAADVYEARGRLRRD